MPDYGHPLRFGTFITPTNSPAERPVELAVLSEQLGFDLVTFQDHPYQPRFSDTWTLLTWVAATTERIHLSGNVLNSALRPPAVLARSAASLDLLSHGRFELGLGAGGFWDAIAAMGGPAWTPGQGVDALAEAIEIIRGIWDAAERRPLRVAGSRWHVDGAKRGPAPAHEIPIWIGALKPRMLRLIGRVGDGWLPSLPYLQPGDLQRGNATIDAAATAAGRDPGEIVRLLNVSPQSTAEELVRYALEDGVSTFIFMGDDPDTLRFLAGELVPQVREGVAAGRAQAGTPAASARTRSSAARAKRMPGIDYDGVPASLAQRAVEPGDVAYARYTSGYLRGGAPGLVLRPQTVAEVADAVDFAGRHRELPLGIFSAGHGLSGRSLNRGGLVIDVGAFDDIEVLDGASGRVRVGPGARWLDVARALAPHGLAITSGDYGGVGVGGLATAGGVGWFAREHGLTIDHLRSVDVVLASGEHVRAAADENPELFWAMRGAGANFGVAVSFEFQAQRVGRLGFAQLAFDASDTAGFLTRWGAAVEASDRRVTGSVILSGGGRARYAQALIAVDSDDPDTIVELLQPIAGVAPLVDQSVALATYDQVMAAFVSDEPQQAQGEPHSHSGLIEHLTPAFAADAAALLDAGASYFFQLRAVGGAVADVPAEATAYGWRGANFSVAAFGTRSSGLDEWWRRLEPHFAGLYLSFETDTGPDALARAFPAGHLARLRELKRRYDPSGLFRDNFFIAPTASERAA
ncbi:hypothetical protein GCM10022288_17910 [Gryllotalpicola kribbensis]|uniref:FAD-binding PCMH-type domain-containing protein n=1 Tax=Gryllotalpicola kribbensis TaxID=993084 RepID=A0ABP8ASZ2_9MICO